MLKRFRELEKLAGQDNCWPVVSMRYGYASFVAYVFRIKHQDKPNEYWVGEMDKDHNITNIKQICLY